MSWVTLSVENIQILQAEQIKTYGGSPGLRDLGLLESAVGRVQNKVTYQPEASIAEVAASLSFGLIKNHAFIDGNKRIGLVALVTFLKANGFILTAAVEDEIAMVLKVAASEIGEEEWTAWVARSVAAL